MFGGITYDQIKTDADADAFVARFVAQYPGDPAMLASTVRAHALAARDDAFSRWSDEGHPDAWVTAYGADMLWRAADRFDVEGLVSA